MEFVITDKETDSVTNIAYGVIEHIMTPITESGKVSKSDVLSVEAMIGSEIPKSIKNTITTVSSKHGHDSFVAHIRSITCVDKLIHPNDILTKLYKLAKAISEVEIVNVLHELDKALIAVEGIYVPNRVKDICGSDVKCLADIDVSNLVSGTLVSRTFSGINNRVLRFLRKQETVVAYGKLVILANMCKTDSTYISLEGTCIAYEGTLRDYILDYRKVLSTFNKDNATLVKEMLAEFIEHNIRHNITTNFEDASDVKKAYRIVSSDNLLDH